MTYTGSMAETPDLCPQGCYWECEHRAPSSVPSRDEGTSAAVAPGTGLFPVEDTKGRPLQRCRDCGDFFYSIIEHARDHEQLRQLGMIPDDPLPQPWGDARYSR